MILPMLRNVFTNNNNEPLGIPRIEMQKGLMSFLTLSKKTARRPTYHPT